MLSGPARSGSGWAHSGAWEEQGRLLPVGGCLFCLYRSSQLHHCEFAERDSLHVIAQVSENGADETMDAC